jgi:hypothetical protein
LATATPTWAANNLRRHHAKRLREEPGCFEDLLGLPAGSTMTELQYDVRSLDAVTDSWAEYEGESWIVDRGEYAEARAYFVDDELVVAITDGFRHEFITCFHEHFGDPDGVTPGAVSVAGRRLHYQTHLRKDEQGKLIRKVRRIRGF